MTTASTRIWTFGAVFLMIIVVALGWFLGISPKLADAARFEAERRNVLAQNDLARATIAQLEADFEQIDELRADLALLRDEFPTDAEYDTAIEELLNSLLAQGLTLQNIAISEPAPTTSLVLEEGVEPPAPEVDGTGILPAGSLLRITVTVTVNGPLPAVFAFIEALQLSPRFSIVPSGDFSGGAAASGSASTFSLIMYAVSGEDLLAGDPVEEPVAEPSPEPEPSETSTSGPTESSTPTPTPTP